MARRKAPEAGGAARLGGFIAACSEFQQARGIVVAFSGGLDSTVLLHLLHAAHALGAIAAPLRAVHVNHALQSDADRWEAHCRAVCEQLHVEFRGVRSPVVQVPGTSLEESARDTRHSVFTETLSEGEVLALAQHRDDQVETVLFRLLRGSGAAGLAGMPRSRPCGAGMLVRPLLEVTRAELLEYARAHALTWVDDGSNADRRFDRNFLRNAVLPLLYERWPGLGSAVTRSAALSAEAAALCDELAVNDLRSVVGSNPRQLELAPLQQLSAARQRNVLRHWLQTACAQLTVAMPTYEVLTRSFSEVIAARPDAEPVLTWGEGDAAAELRRYRGFLHVLKPLPALPGTLSWSTDAPCMLSAPFGELSVEPCSGRGIPRERIPALRVCFRSGGELVKAAGRPTRPLKKILQDAGVPPWLRERIPLLYAGDDLVAVADLLICDGWLSETAESRCRIVWMHPDLDCGYPPHLLI
ncbi:MAG: tRNA lysidine(34) synthetase TilS [Pseudomonadota bacterium]|nr:tRNA lysidine(34) synthetase TilS [Pseudomonadota bacterium]